MRRLLADWLIPLLLVAGLFALSGHCPWVAWIVDTTLWLLEGALAVCLLLWALGKLEVRWSREAPLHWLRTAEGDLVLLDQEREGDVDVVWVIPGHEGE